MDHLHKIYSELEHSAYPVFIWGAGSMSKEVQKRLEERKIPVKGRFINTKRADAHIVSDKEHIFTLDEIEKQYDKIDVVMGHGHYEKRGDLGVYPFIHKVYIIPNPYSQYKGPDLEYIYQNQEQLDYICGHLADYDSVRALERYMAVSVTNDISYLFDGEICVDGIFGLKQLQITDRERFVDIGAWEGDSIDLFLKTVRNRYDKIYAFEPDPELFSRLKHNNEGREGISLFSYGLGEKDGEFYLERESTQSASLSSDGESGKKVLVRTIDGLLKDKKASLIKISVPFMFPEILKGGIETIKENRPRLIINVAACDRFLVYDTVKWIVELGLPYKLALRFDFPMPTRLYLYAF